MEEGEEEKEEEEDEDDQNHVGPMGSNKKKYLNKLVGHTYTNSNIIFFFHPILQKYVTNL